jgi:hypothetical protein
LIGKRGLLLLRKKGGTITTVALYSIPFSDSSAIKDTLRIMVKPIPDTKNLGLSGEVSQAAGRMETRGQVATQAIVYDTDKSEGMLKVARHLVEVKKGGI